MIIGFPKGTLTDWFTSYVFISHVTSGPSLLVLVVTTATPDWSSNQSIIYCIGKYHSSSRQYYRSCKTCLSNYKLQKVVSKATAVVSNKCVVYREPFLLVTIRVK